LLHIVIVNNKHMWIFSVQICPIHCTSHTHTHTHIFSGSCGKQRSISTCIKSNPGHSPEISRWKKRALEFNWWILVQKLIKPYEGEGFPIHFVLVTQWVPTWHSFRHCFHHKSVVKKRQ